MSMFEFLFSSLAGFTFLLIGSIILSIIIYGPFLNIQLYVLKKKNIKKTNIDVILILGVIVFISGIHNRIAGMIGALEMMVETTEISHQMVMSGLIKSFKTPVFCTFLLIISLIFWYFNKRNGKALISNFNIF